jgi:hypothetical protein
MPCASSRLADAAGSILAQPAASPTFPPDVAAASPTGNVDVADPFHCSEAPARVAYPSLASQRTTLRVRSLNSLAAKKLPAARLLASPRVG